MKEATPTKAYERFEPPKKVRIPKGTVEYVRDDEHGDTFGVRRIVETSSDGNVLISFANGTHELNDIRVRMNPSKMTGDTLNEIGQTVMEFLETRAKYESVPRINAPVDDLHEELRLLLGSQFSDPSRGIGELRRAIAELGIIQDRLKEGMPRTLKDLLRHLKTLAFLEVVYFSQSL